MNDTVERQRRPKPLVIGATKYRPQWIEVLGEWAFFDKDGDVPPGDPDGPPFKRGTQVAKGHRAEDLYGWEYRTTTTYDDVITPPAGDGWELNTLARDSVEGHVKTTDRGGRECQVSHWRRRKP